MVSHCANPRCRTPFRYLREGRLFHFELPAGRAAYGSSIQVERFWLCGDCSAQWTVTFDGTSVQAVLRPSERGSHVR